MLPRCWTPFALLLTLTIGCGDDSAVGPDGSGDAGATTTSATTAGASNSGSGLVTMTGTATGTTAADETGPPPPADQCMCQVPDLEAVGCGFEQLPQWSPGCPDAMPCDRVTVECMRPGQDLYDCMGQELVYDEPALQCALETLRDQVPARLELDGREDMGIFTSQLRIVLHVLGEGMAVSASCQSTDVGFIGSGPRAREVMGASHFEGCLALPTAAERYDCLWEGLVVLDELPTCGS